MINEIAIEALFLALFDDHKGQSLIWKRSRNADTKYLEGVEFQALPSGLHLVEKDTFYFDHASSSSNVPEQEHRLGVAVFHNKELDEEEIKRAGKETGGRGRLMLSLGVIMGETTASSVDFPPLSSLRDLVARISAEWDYTLTGVQGETARQAWLDELLEPFWDRHRSSSTASSGLPRNEGSAVQALSDGSLGVSADHPIRYFDRLFKHFDINTCTLWKYATTNRRILFFSHTPLEPSCQAAFCTWLLGQTSTNSPSRFLGSIGLMDMTKIQALKGGWVACTSDAIFKDRPQLWDLLVDLGSDPLPTSSSSSGSLEMSTRGIASAGTISMRARFNPETETPDSKSKPTIYTKSVSHTFSDKALWKDVQDVFCRDDDAWQSIEKETASTAGVWSYAYGAYSTLCEVCWGFCAMAVGMGGRADHVHSGGTGYIRLPLDGDAGLLSDDEDEREESEDLVRPTGGDHNGLQRTTAALDVFHRQSSRLVSKIDKLRSKGALSNADMAALGLSAWSWVDVDFVRAMHANAKRDLDDRSQEQGVGLDIQVEKGWFRWVSSLVGA